MGSRKVTNPGSRRTHNAPGASGLPVDAGGNPTIDPTENVISLVEAANLRQDDLRQASDKYNDAQIDHMKEIIRLRAEFDARLHVANEKSDLAESKRIDAIRAVDVGAVAIASEKAAATATVLANQVQQSADSLRTLVATTAAAATNQQNQLFNQFNERLTSLERSQSEGKGKGSVTDPQLVTIMEELKNLNKSANQSAGRVAERKDYTGYIIAAISIIFYLLNYFKA